MSDPAPETPVEQDTVAVDGEGEPVAIPEPEASADETATPAIPEAGESPEQDYSGPPEGYVPVLARTPEALEEERVANEARAFEARVKSVSEQLGISLDEARATIAGS